MFTSLQKTLAPLLFASFFIATAHADETDYRSITQLKSKGFNTCASSQATVTKWLYDKDDFAFFGLWNASDPDSHTGSTLISEKYSDGTTLSLIATTQTIKGECDTNFVHILPTSKSCPELRDTSFKDWKFYTDLAGTPVYSDPTSTSVSVMLVQAGTGCLIVKQGSVFFPKPDKVKK